jgi:tRNA G18 (ribose-2'-O)-methylase SpoU
MRGFFGIGVWHPKHDVNIGTLWRSAACFGAAMLFTVGRRYKRQGADTVNAPRTIPLYHYTDIDDLIRHLPYSVPLVDVELGPDSVSLTEYEHLPAACYLLGAEDHGLSAAVLERCHARVAIPGLTACLNVAVAGSIVMYDRALKRGVLNHRVTEAS